MTGWWLASYAALWVVTLGSAVFLLGALHQLGVLQRSEDQSGRPPDGTFPTLEDDGPPRGSGMLQFSGVAINGYGLITQEYCRGRPAVIVFLSPLCESCQHAIATINDTISTPGWDGACMIILRGDNQSCTAFQALFPVACPLICDSDRTITSVVFQAHRNPFALYYDGQSILQRKGLLLGHEYMQALLHGRTDDQPITTSFHPTLAIATEIDALL